MEISLSTFSLGFKLLHRKQYIPYHLVSDDRNFGLSNSHF